MGLSFEMLSFRLVSRTSIQLSCLHTKGKDRNVQFEIFTLEMCSLKTCSWLLWVHTKN